MPDAPRHDLELTGCTPEPLMAYLKALGILRLVSEQKDAEARGWWKNDVFRLRSTLDREALVRFFLEEYVPTPIVAPWAGGSGFFKKDNTKAVDALRESCAGRCRAYADAIRRVTDIIAQEKIDDKPQGDEKTHLIRRYRCELPDDVVMWMDAAMVIQQDGQGFAPLLGTGGNDGRLDFTQNFMQRIVLLGLHQEEVSSDESRAWLMQALFASPTRLRSASVGQFSPGRAGGPNATQGMEGDALDNPWDYLLMIEGTLVLGGAVVRRYGVDASAQSSFPFTVQPVAAGFETSAPAGPDSASSKDETESRGEMWLPIWERSARMNEVRQLFGEGRATIRRHPVRNAVDFARAVASLGIDRGLSGFHRLGFLKRSGKAYLAAPLGRYGVVAREDIDRIREIDERLDRFRRAVTDKNTPRRFGVALRRIDAAIFDFCKYGGHTFFQRILTALGNAERELANAERFRKDKKIQPFGHLSPRWAGAADDRSLEFAVAQCLAGIRGIDSRIGSLRTNLEPVDWKKGCSAWAEKGRCVVWNAADLATNLANVLERRMMDGARDGCERLPLDSKFGVRLDIVAAFLDGRLDERRIEELIWGLVLINWKDDITEDGPRTVGVNVDDPPPLPRQYALLKLLFLPRPLVPERTEQGLRWRFARRRKEGWENGLSIRPEPRVLPLLRAGRIEDACRIAAHRLRVSGLAPMPAPTSTGETRDGEWSEHVFDSEYARRLAAAMLIPISSNSIHELVALVCRIEDSAALESLVFLREGETP